MSKQTDKEKQEAIRQRADDRAQAWEDVTLVLGFVATLLTVALALVATC